MERAPDNATFQFTLQRLLVAMVVFSIACTWAKGFLSRVNSQEYINGYVWAMDFFSPTVVGALMFSAVGILCGRPFAWTLAGAFLGTPLYGFYLMATR
ncbi:MAG: hypothetical protein JNM18_00290 [Planctomycetaceae bacterium]|nr:hypothetical protein [Planctomycetaceae bacterium]